MHDPRVVSVSARERLSGAVIAGFGGALVGMSVLIVVAVIAYAFRLDLKVPRFETSVLMLVSPIPVGGAFGLWRPRSVIRLANATIRFMARHRYS